MAVTVTIVIAVLAVLAVHELGHLLGGRLVGFRFFMIVVGPIRVHRERDRLRVGLNRSLALAGGVAAAGPAAGDVDRLRSRTAFMVAAGPVCSLLAGGLAAGAFHLLGGDGVGAATVGTAAVALDRSLLIFALSSIAIGVVTLIPGRSSGFMTDGARLLQLLRGGRAAEADAAIVTLLAWSMGGVRPREWDPAILDCALGAPEGLFRSLAHHFAWRHATDCGDRPGVEDHRDRLLAELDHVPETVRPALLLDVATAQALDGDVGHARTLMDRAGRVGALVEPHAEALAHAAIAAAEGRQQDAADAADRAAHLLDRAMDRSTALVARERLDRIREILRRNAAR